MLGLGLGFIRGMFGKVSTQFTEMIESEADPPPASGSEPISLSRETIVTHSGDTEILKVSVYNVWGAGGGGGPIFSCSDATSLGVCNILKGCWWDGSTCIDDSPPCYVFSKNDVADIESGMSADDVKDACDAIDAAGGSCSRSGDDCNGQPTSYTCADVWTMDGPDNDGERAWACSLIGGCRVNSDRDACEDASGSASCSDIDSLGATGASSWDVADAAAKEAACTSLLGCTWSGGLCTGGGGGGGDTVTPDISCVGPAGSNADTIGEAGHADNEETVNPKDILPGESETFNVIFKTQDVTTGTYLCKIDISQDYSKDFTIRITK